MVVLSGAVSWPQEMFLYSFSQITVTLSPTKQFFCLPWLQFKSGTSLEPKHNHRVSWNPARWWGRDNSLQKLHCVVDLASSYLWEWYYTDTKIIIQFCLHTTGSFKGDLIHRETGNDVAPSPLKWLFLKNELRLHEGCWPHTEKKEGVGS